MDEDRRHPDTPRAAELVIRTVADEHRLGRFDAELLAAGQVNPGIGLADPDPRGEDLRVEEAGELRVRPDRLDVLRADRDQTEAITALAQRLERRHRAGPGDDRAPDVVGPDTADLVQG